MISLLLLLLVCKLSLGVQVTDKLLKEGDDYNNDTLAGLVDGDNFVLIELEIASLAWSEELQMGKPKFTELEEDLAESLSLLLNSTDLNMTEIVSVEMSSDKTVMATIVMVFVSDYTSYYADRLVKISKPSYGKTKPLGKHQISRFSAKPFIKLGSKTVFKIITTADAPDKPPEFFRNRAEMRSLVESEESNFTQALNSLFTVKSHKRTLQNVHTRVRDQLLAHYTFYLAEVYLIDKIITYEMYVWQ